MLTRQGRSTARLVLLCLGLTATLLASSTLPVSAGEPECASPVKAFVHPGLLHSRVDLERIKEKVAAGREPWKSGFEKLRTHDQSRSSWKLRGPFETVTRDPRGWVHNQEMVLDGNAAYQNALMWCITGDEAHARKAVEILNAWGRTLKKMDGGDVQLAAGLNGFKFISAAELLRATYPHWSAEDITQFQKMLREAIYPPLEDFAPFANGNWDGACIKTMMAVGVFCDDREIFDRAVDYFNNGKGDGSLTHYIINETGQCQESGRDQQHTQLGLGQLAEACEIGWNQGLDLYGSADNRLLKGFEYTARYNLDEEVPFVAHVDTTGKSRAKVISTEGRGNLRPIYEMVWNHYHNRRGLDAPWTQRAAEKIRPEGAAFGSDHVGFGTLLFSRPGIVDASEFGFSPEAEAGQNVAALQKALEGGHKTVTVTRPGEYSLNARVFLDDETKLVLAPGVVLKKTGHYDFVLVNRGALTRTWNHDISIDGLAICVNGVDQCPSRDEPVFGLRGQLTMYFVRNLAISRFQCLDLAKSQFCLHFCQFDHLVLDTFEIRGDKDGVHLGVGKNFVVRNGVCATKDDGIALNAQDYPTSQPMQGDIVDGVVENVTDLHKEKTGGNSVRMLSGAWPDWHTGMSLKNGDTLRHGKNVYRVLSKEKDRALVSTTAPVHEQGAWTDAAGLTFYHSQSDGAVSATVRNVVFRNLRFQEDRNSFKTSWDFGAVNRAIHPETPRERIPVIEATIQNVTASGMNPFIQGNASCRLQLEQIECRGPFLSMQSNKDTNCTITVSGASLAAAGETAQEPDIVFDGAGTLNLTLDRVTQGHDLRLQIGKNAYMRLNGSASVSTLEGLSPVKGDSIKVRNVQKTYTGSGWESVDPGP